MMAIVVGEAVWFRLDYRGGLKRCRGDEVKITTNNIASLKVILASRCYRGYVYSPMLPGRGEG